MDKQKEIKKQTPKVPEHVTKFLKQEKSNVSLLLKRLEELEKVTDELFSKVEGAAKKPVTFTEAKDLSNKATKHLNAAKRIVNRKGLYQLDLRLFEPPSTPALALTLTEKIVSTINARSAANSKDFDDRIIDNAKRLECYQSGFQKFRESTAWISKVRARLPKAVRLDYKPVGTQDFKNANGKRNLKDFTFALVKEELEAPESKPTNFFDGLE